MSFRDSDVDMGIQPEQQPEPQTATHSAQEVVEDVEFVDAEEEQQQQQPEQQQQRTLFNRLASVTPPPGMPVDNNEPLVCKLKQSSPNSYIILTRIQPPSRRIPAATTTISAIPECAM